MTKRNPLKSLRQGVALTTLLLTACADQNRVNLATQQTVTTEKETSVAGSAPIELRRLTKASDSSNASSSGESGTLYKGSGLLYSPPPRASSAVKAANDGDISLDFVNADVRDVAKSILGDLLGLNYTVDSTVQGNITVQTNQKISKSDILPAFETVLRVNGLALVQRDSFYTIVPFGNAGKAGNLDSRDEGYGTEIVPLQYVGPEQMRRVLEPLIPQGTIVQVDQTRNLMVIGGTRGERAAIRENIATFDVNWLRGMSFAIFKPRVATAKQMTEELTHIMGDENSPMTGQVRLIPIERMNAVLAISPQAKYLDDLKVWVSRLDQGNDTTDRRIFVYYVQNGRAGDLASVLGKALGIRNSSSQSESGNRSSTNQSVSSGRSFSSTGSQQNQSSGLFSNGTSGTSSLGSGFQTQASQQTGQAQTGSNTISAGSSGTSTASSGTQNNEAGALSITADEVNNALLVVATSNEYGIIEAALKKLDILPLQVMIEAAIAEVTLTKDLNFGVQWKFNNDTNNVSLNSATSNALSPSLPGFNYVYSSGSRINAVLSALADVTHVDVLSSPKLMVLNNQTAVLQVGDQVPIATQSSVSTLTSDAPVVNSIQYKDTGVILTVTPRVNEGGLVLMDISQEVSDVAATTSSTLNSPTINERKIGSTVAIQDGQTVALGGLIRDNRSVGNSGVPYLQDIPVLGHLFREDNRSSTRTELLVLITPRVVRDSRGAAAITEELRGKLTDLKDEFVSLPHGHQPGAE